jgi:NTP pyrophosphohydrolases containing a Zn-finger, probably nucleic-acid-binding
VEQYNIYTNYENGVTAPEEINENSIWFIFKGNRLLVKQINNGIHVPSYKEINGIESASSSFHYLGELDGTNCYTIKVDDKWEQMDEYTFEDLRTIMGQIDYTVCELSGKAYQVLYWDETHKYCGKCGTPTENLDGERAKVCPKCGFMSYPRISPAIIVAITKGDKILLAHNSKFKKKMYSTIAGFVEPGETFEEAVMREVKEEVGICVKNIKYFASQPWPFPNSLMIAFTAEYESGEIMPDGIEIEDAQWFFKDSMPEGPLKGSVARKLIDWYLYESHL